MTKTATRAKVRPPAKATARRSASVQQQASAENRGLPGVIGGGPHAELMTVTPELAEDWLGRNSHNRPIRQKRIDELVGVIQRGEWCLNGDSIRFDRTGTLQDGQHRLWAIVLTETPVESMVVTGLDPDAQETMDVGARRSLKDALSLRGESDASKLAAVLSYKWRYDSGHVRLATAKPSIAQAMALLEQHPGIREAVAQAGRIVRRFRMSISMAAVAVYEFAGIDQENCDVFVEKLTSGAGLEEGDPILVLRRYLERQSMAGGGSRAKAVITHAVIIKAWNAWREGRQVESLTWRAAGIHAEGFPEAH